MKSFTRLAAALLVTSLFVGCEAEKPAAPPIDAAPSAPAPVSKVNPRAKAAAPSSAPSNKPVD